MAQIVPVGRMLKIKVLVCLLFNWTPLIAKGPLLVAAPIMIVKAIKKYIGDPMRTHIATTLVIGLLAVLPVSSRQPQTNPAAQAPADVAKPSANSAQADVDKGKDSTIVHAEPGKHQLQSSAKNEPATVIETVAGGTTYVQMVILMGNWRGGGRLLQVDAGEAQKVIAKLKPLHD